MLYLEDYLELIEHLPQELRDRFTDMRELDLTVQNNLDTLEKRVKLLFNECRRYPGEIPTTADTEFQAIRQEYYKTLEEADEKVQLANTMYDLVDRYLRRLDTELHKFKCELEADNKGITEVLEKRSLELDAPMTPAASSQKENRYDRYSTGSSSVSRARDRRRESSHSYAAEKRHSVSGALSATLDAGTTIAARASLGGSGGIVLNQGGGAVASASTNSQYNFGAGTAIAAAASQAIAATQQMQQGRRTASLKASYEAINTGLNVHDHPIGRDLAGAAQTAIQAIQQDSHKHKKKKVSNSSGSSSSSAAIQQQLLSAVASAGGHAASVSHHHIHHQNATAAAAAAAAVAAASSAISPTAPESPSLDAGAQEVTDGEWTYDPNEPRYCLCNQVSYGDMVACDNEDCPSEWFHYPCVGITAPPKGKWYCPQCTASMRRRGARKN